MAQPLPGSDPTPPDDYPVDDFTQIRGIGPNRCQWLQRSLQIFTFADLSTASVDIIAEHLKHQRHAVSHQEIAGWIAQAATIVTTTEVSKVPNVEVTRPDPLEHAADHQEPNAQELDPQESDPQESDPQKSDLQEPDLQESDPAKETVRANGAITRAAKDLKSSIPPAIHDGVPDDTRLWRSLATVSLEIQVQTTAGVQQWRTVVHNPNTQATQIFAGVDLTEFRQWLQTHLATLPLSEPAASAPLPHPTATLAQMQVTQMSARVMVVEPLGSMVLGPWRSDRPFEVAVTFHVPELWLAAAIASDSATYSLQIFAGERTTRRSTCLAEVSGQPLTAAFTTCTLSNLMLSSGFYRLEVQIHLDRGTPGYFKFPRCVIQG